MGPERVEKDTVEGELPGSGALLLLLLLFAVASAARRRSTRACLDCEWSGRALGLRGRFVPRGEGAARRGRLGRGEVGASVEAAGAASCRRETRKAK